MLSRILSVFASLFTLLPRGLAALALLALATLALPAPASAQLNTLPPNIAPSSNRCIAAYTTGKQYVLGWAFITNTHAVGSPKEATPDVAEFVVNAGACSPEYSAGEARKLADALEDAGTAYVVVSGGSSDMKDFRDAGNSDELNTRLAMRRRTLMEEAAKKVGLPLTHRDLVRIKQTEELRISYLWVIPEKDLTKSLRDSFSLADTNEIMRLGRLPDVSDLPFHLLLPMADWACGGDVVWNRDGMPESIKRTPCQCMEDVESQLSSDAVATLLRTWAQGSATFDPNPGVSGDERVIALKAVSPRASGTVPYGQCSQNEIEAGKTVFDPFLKHPGCRKPRDLKEAIVGLKQLKLPDYNRAEFEQLYVILESFGVSIRGDLFDDTRVVFQFPDRCPRQLAEKTSAAETKRVGLYTPFNLLVAGETSHGPQWVVSGPDATWLPLSYYGNTGLRLAGVLGDRHAAFSFGGYGGVAWQPQHWRNQAGPYAGFGLGAIFGDRAGPASVEVAGRWLTSWGPYQGVLAIDHHRFEANVQVRVHPLGDQRTYVAFGAFAGFNYIWADGDQDGLPNAQNWGVAGLRVEIGTAIGFKKKP